MSEVRLSAPVALALLISLTACPPPASPSIPDSGLARPDGGQPDAGPHDAGPPDRCDAGSSYCIGYGAQAACRQSASYGALDWATEQCPQGTACVNAQCAPSCADSCPLGAVIPGDGGSDGGGWVCADFSVAMRGPAPGDAGAGTMHDRARFYSAYLRQWGMPGGFVAGMDFTGPDLQTISTYDDLGDSALWSGTYLAAEALRLKATGSADARATVEQLVRQIHILWSVAGAGSPGWLARYAVPVDAGTVLMNLIANEISPHYDGQYGGQTYAWLGHISRDQYQGVMLGYALAYEALDDEQLKELIRHDVVTFVTRLTQKTTICPVVNGIPCLTPLEVYDVVTTDKEPLAINIDTSNISNSTLSGAQEFQPKLLNVYARPSSAIMLASFFEVALEVTDGQPQYASQRATIENYYVQNVAAWLNVAEGWTFTENCGSGYFANNITFEPAYNLARLEQDPARSYTIRYNILQQALWNGVSTQKNVFFAYIYAANTPPGVDAASVVAAANAQLAQFPDGPRVHWPVNNTFPEDSSCPGSSVDPIDVGLRPVEDFLWQRSPWTESDPGNPQQVYPGVDYLVAYWMGRYHGFLTDDTPGVCAQWVSQ